MQYFDAFQMNATLNVTHNSNAKNISFSNRCCKRNLQAVLDSPFTNCKATCDAMKIRKNYVWRHCVVSIVFEVRIKIGIKDIRKTNEITTKHNIFVKLKC